MAGDPGADTSARTYRGLLPGDDSEADSFSLHLCPGDGCRHEVAASDARFHGRQAERELAER